MPGASGPVDLSRKCSGQRPPSVRPARRRDPWRTLEAVERATLEWIDWFNNRRLLEPIGNIPPAEAETRVHAGAKELAMVA